MRKQIFWFVIFGLITFKVSAQLSPGDLTSAHAHLEGISNCTQCHDLGEKVSNNKCLSCHKAIKSRIDQKEGYHSSREVKGKECAECHSEHHGRKFEMIRFDEKSFDHNLTGYELTGAHKTADCRQCHKPDFMDQTNIDSPEKSFLGLDQQCLSCHTDYHQNTLPTDCNKCHVTEAFEPATKFDHDKSKFALLGKHKEVDCASCHKEEIRNGREFQQFTGLDFANCNSCHDDPHQNNLGTDCKSCHKESSFQDFVGRNRFNHNTTHFPLKGKHRPLDCKECHTINTGPLAVFQDRKGVAVNDCNTCHEDVHDGKFGLSCSDCHNENSFTASINLDAFNHNLTDFALQGKHEEVDCKKCHVSESFTEPLPFNTCTACHEDYHEGAFMVNLEVRDCADCHAVTGFEETLFTVEQHQETDFPLEGSHLATACFECHLKEDTWTFADLGNRCVDCHEDIHRGYIASTYYPEQECTQCHSTSLWAEVQFDHSLTEFQLEGKHAEASCLDCHGKPEIMKSDQKWSGFEEVSMDCITCHENIHKDQFAINGVTDCKRCHAFEDWSASNFDHSTTAFPLEGRHAEIECKDCHKPMVVNNEVITQYKFESFECVVCHY
jgi:nitrate/TMAO reductase-like tetraheme cytochrome c subunit